MVQVIFHVVLKTELLPVTISDDAQVFQIFQYLKSEFVKARGIIGRSSLEQYDYYNLKNPVPIPRRNSNTATIVQTCMDRNNWERVLPQDGVDTLAPMLSGYCVHMVIQPKGDAESVIANLDANYAEIFSSLQITVSTLQRWSTEDVINNLGGGRWWYAGDLYGADFPSNIPNAISQIEQALVEGRTYIVPQGEEIRDYQNAQAYATHFNEIFEAALNPPGKVTNREFATFFHVLRCFDEDSDRITNDESSAMKASNLVVYFISPAFFSGYSPHFEFKQEKSWGFPIFICTQDQPETWCRFSPRSDFMVSSRSFLCPFLISEVVSDSDESDRFRMLLEAIAVARAGQYLTRQGQFFVVAVYLRANLTAERYVVANIGSREVFITQKDFSLNRADGAVAFLREMYNLADILEGLAGNLDTHKTQKLSQVNRAAAKVISLTAKAKQKKTGGTDFMGSIGEADEDDEAQDDLGVFGADDIQAILKRMNYKINFIPFGYPLIASVSHVTHESEKGYLKFVKEGRREIEILQYLAGIDSPANHTISDFRIWPVHGGNVISMPVAGSWITHLENPNAELWSVAKQLFEAVDFMHQHGVAHMDLKPENVLIPIGGGRLSIIDFNRSVRVNGVGHKFRGVVGTPGYIAPEVAAGEGRYSAICADLWSCGKTLEDLCLKCLPSVDRDTMLEISRQLMDEDPEKRPTMSDVLDRLARCTVDAATRPDSLSFYSVAPPEVNA